MSVLEANLEALSVSRDLGRRTRNNHFCNENTNHNLRLKKIP